MVHPPISNGTELQVSENATQQNTSQPGSNVEGKETTRQKRAFPTITISSTQRTNSDRAKEGREKENRNTPVRVTFSDLLFL